MEAQWQSGDFPPVSSVTSSEARFTPAGRLSVHEFLHSHCWILLRTARDPAFLFSIGVVACISTSFPWWNTIPLHGFLALLIGQTFGLLAYFYSQTCCYKQLLECTYTPLSLGRCPGVGLLSQPQICTFTLENCKVAFQGGFPVRMCTCPM